MLSPESYPEECVFFEVEAVVLWEIASEYKEEKLSFTLFNTLFPWSLVVLWRNRDRRRCGSSDYQEIQRGSGLQTTGLSGRIQHVILEALVLSVIECANNTILSYECVVCEDGFNLWCVFVIFDSQVSVLSRWLYIICFVSCNFNKRILWQPL